MCCCGRSVPRSQLTRSDSFSEGCGAPACWLGTRTTPNTRAADVRSAVTVGTRLRRGKNYAVVVRGKPLRWGFPIDSRDKGVMDSAYIQFYNRIL